LISDILLLKLSDINPRLFIPTASKNNIINHGNIFFILIFSLLTLLSLLSFNLTFSLIYEKINTIGTTDKVLVNFTIIAKLPATSENAYPAATTEEVSFTAVPVHNPNPKSLIPKYFPAIGKSTLITISNTK